MIYRVFFSSFTHYLSNLGKALVNPKSTFFSVKKLHGGDIRQTDIATYRLNRRMGRFSDKIQNISCNA